MKKTVLLSILWVGLLSFAANGQDRYLVQDGRPEARIFLPRVFGKGTLLAANELADFIEKMTGARIPVDTTGTMTERAAQRQGLTQVRLEPSIDSTREVSADGTEDVFTLTVDRDTLTIAGNSDTAVLYGVYQFLEEQGVRWFLPGEIGQHVPRTPDLKLVPGTRTYRPSFRTREIGLSGTPPTHYNEPDFDRLIPEYAMWLLRNRCLYGRDIHRDRRPAVNKKREYTGHSLPNILRGVDIEKEPERFPLVTRNGETTRTGKSAQICFTDPRNVAETVRTRLAAFENDPTMLTASVSLGDHAGFCECERCIAANDGRFPPLEPNLVVWKFMNQVSRGIREKMPHKRIAFYSCYGGLTSPPKGFKVEEGIVAITANTGANNVRIDDPDDPFARTYMADILASKAAGAELGAREYTMFSGTPQPLVLLEQIKIYHDLGFVYYHCESMGRDALLAPVQWVQAQLLWNADRDPDALLEECCHTLYGPAGDAVLQAMRAIDARARSLPRIILGSQGVMQWIMSPELCAQARGILKTAAPKVTGVQGRRLRQFSDSFEMFALQATYVRACYEAMDARTDDTRAKALKQITAFETFWHKRDLFETCSANILGKARQFRSLIESLDSAAGPTPRKGYDAPTPEQKLAALYSLLDIPKHVESLYYLPDLWKFKPDIKREAEEQGWSAPDFDDSTWRELSTYNFYERQGYDRYDGAFCYRVRFNAPAFPAGKRIMLRIGSLDDEGAIYINGKLAYRRWHLVGQDWKRSFAFDATAFIRPGEANSIAILGNDEYGVGGLWNPCALYTAK